MELHQVNGQSTFIPPSCLTPTQNGFMILSSVESSRILLAIGLARLEPGGDWATGVLDIAGIVVASLTPGNRPCILVIQM